MRKISFILTLAVVLLASCRSIRFSQLSTHDKIVDHYEYVHSWDYASPDGLGKMHCDETGTLDFKADGTYVDEAMQEHYHILPDSTRQHYQMSYYCEGDWKVEGDKFLFNEHSENFKMGLTDDLFVQERFEFAERIAMQNTPNSSRWFTFDIERLDRSWFIWSYTDKHGTKTTWDMQRKEVRK